MFFSQSKTVTFVVVWAVLLFLFLMSYFLDGESDIFDPIMTFIIYGPLFLLELIDLPVTNSGNGGWGSPNFFGWFLLIVLYSLVAYGIASFVERLKRKNTSPYVG